MTFGSLFAGIGGLDLGLERAGLRCAWQVEIDPFCRRVLAKHWPEVRRHDDVRTFPPGDGDWGVDLVAGGFPCQPVSLAGKQRGGADERWLWPEFARVLRVLRPRYAIVENVPGLLSLDGGRWFREVLGDLAALGFDAEWSVLSACALGAPHPRERLFLVAYACGVLGEKGLRLREHGAAREISARDDVKARVLRMESAHRDRGSPDGLSERVGHEFRAVGGAVMPQVAEFIGRRILEAS